MPGKLPEEHGENWATVFQPDTSLVKTDSISDRPQTRLIPLQKHSQNKQNQKHVQENKNFKQTNQKDHESAYKLDTDESDANNKKHLSANMKKKYIASSN